MPGPVTYIIAGIIAIVCAIVGFVFGSVHRRKSAEAAKCVRTRARARVCVCVCVCMPNLHLDFPES